MTPTTREGWVTARPGGHTHGRDGTPARSGVTASGQGWTAARSAAAVAGRGWTAARPAAAVAGQGRTPKRPAATVSGQDPMPARATDEGAYLWRGSVALRAERTARHRRMRSVVLVLAVFAYALLQIRISTEIAERGSRVTQLSREMARLQEEIKIARARLDRVQIYPDLLEPAQAAGFAPGGTHRVIWSSEESQAAEADLWAEVRGELKRGTDVLLPQAIAREIRPPERGRAQRP